MKQAAMMALLSTAAGGAFAASGTDGGNPHAPAYGHAYRHGAVPTLPVQAKIQAWESAHPSPLSAASSNTLNYGGGTSSSSQGNVGVMNGKTKVYLVFYGSGWGTQSTNANGDAVFSGDPNGSAPVTQEMFKGIGTGSELWSAELTQWCQGITSGSTSCPAGTPASAFAPYMAGGILAGVWEDTSAATPINATGRQLAQEALKAAQHFGNTTAASNRYAYYVIMSAHGDNPDNYKSTTQGYCAWHDWNGDSSLSGGAVSSSVGDFAFSNQPYNMDMGASCGVGFVNSPGTLDGYTMTLGHEWHEMVSDQFPAGGWTATSGYENSDECAWIAAGQAGGAANVIMGTGTFTEQASWSNDTNSCAISHSIVDHGGGGGGGTPTASFSFITNGLTATFADSSTDSGGTISAHAWTFGDGGTSSTASPSHTYAAAGTYSVTETVTDSVNASTNSKTASVTVTGGGSNVLSNGVAVTGLAATTGNQLNYTMVVPAGATNLKFVISGGTGDADLYVKFGSAPTLSSYDCRPYITGNSESCPITTAQAGTYYVMLNSYASFTGVTLTGSYTAPGAGGTPTANFTSSVSGLTATFTDTSTDSGGTISAHAWTFGDGGTSTATSPSHTYAAAGTYSVSETVTDGVSGTTNSKTASVTVSSGGGGSCGGTVLCSGVAVTGLAATKGNFGSTYTMVVPAGQSSVTFQITGSTGDADLYVKIGSAPTTSSYSCRPYLTGDNETCTFNSPTAGTYYVKVRAYATYSGVTLTGTITP